MKFTRSIVKIIQERTSWRTYTNVPLEAEVRNKIEQILKLDDVESPFKNSAGQSRFKLINLPDINPELNSKIGTYGMIKGSQNFIAGVTERSKYELENYGYLFETIILAITDLELGTCWLGGTFSRSQVSDIIQPKDNEIIPAITPVGYPATRRLKEKIIRSFAKAKIRKPWNELFFQGDFNTTITQETLGEYKDILEMVRIGPSAGNRQPWRILKENNHNTYHFFVKYSEDKKVSGYNQFVRLDIGIAICHFDLSVKEKGLSGIWEFKSPNLEIPKGLKYSISWIGG
jgi:nitroreductase